MEFLGEFLFPGKLGHFFVLLAFFSSIVASIGFFKSSFSTNTLDQDNWLKFGRVSFLVHTISVLVVFGALFYICRNHLYEYLYAYKHASKELETKYLLACIWEGQEGSFLLWAMWQAFIGLFIIGRSLFKTKSTFEPIVLGVVSIAQIFLVMMILGIYVGDIRIGNSAFALTRNEFAAPIFSRTDYLSLIKDGMGLNVLLRNYWMVIHPPTLFLGFGLTLVPFAYAVAGVGKKQYSEWVKPAMPWVLLAIAVLGVGIMMGGKWAYESLSFGGYWAWDPVENASLIPWLMLVAGLHTMLIFRATGHSLKAAYWFTTLAFVFVLYSTFLTRTGILGETSVHSFTEAGPAINTMIGLFVLSFFVAPIVLYFLHNNKIPSIHQEENLNSREFWMYIGSLVFFLSGIYIIAKTSVPVINKVFGTAIAPPEDVEFSYNKIMVIIAVIIGILTAIAQYFKYKNTERTYLLKGLLWPTLITVAITLLVAIFYPFTYHKQGPGFLGAIYAAFFASVYMVVANAWYLFKFNKTKIIQGGGSIAHLGFGMMIAGMAVSSANKEVISIATVNGITMPTTMDPQTKKSDNPMENLTLIRQIPTTMGPYKVTFLHDSLGHEKGRKFYKLLFEYKDSTASKKPFTMQPDVYVMKDNNMSSNPDTRAYLTKDVFTYISYAVNQDENKDTAKFTIKEMKVGDSAFYSNGYVVLNGVDKIESSTKEEMGLKADLKVVAQNGSSYAAAPMVKVDRYGINHVDDTVYSQNMFVHFDGVTSDGKIKIGLKESNRFIDFVSVKAFIFPFINLVWLGLVLMAIGSLLSIVKRGKIHMTPATVILVVSALALGYLFLFANQ